MFKKKTTLKEIFFLFDISFSAVYVKENQPSSSQSFTIKTPAV